jgi:uncharacterized SAM-dependent methyltransferase
VDIGSGNAYPLKNFLFQLYQKDLLNKYVAVDISKELSLIAENNVKNWLPNVEVLTLNIDFEKQDLTEILFEIKNNDVINIMFLVGGAYGNLEDREKFLKIIRDSLDGDDILVIQNKHYDPKSFSELKHLDTLKDLLVWIPRMLGVDINSSEIVKRYEPSLESRVVYLKLDKDYDIQFDVKGVIKNVQLLKGQEIRLLKHHMSTIHEVIGESTRSNLELTHYSTNENRSDMICIFDVKH